MALPAGDLILETAEARIGPNAIIRVAEALSALADTTAAERVFARANLSEYLRLPPQQMVAEREVNDLQAALLRELGAGPARSVARSAGTLTGDYLLRKRIPAAAQRLLKRLPNGIASRLLLKAIAKNSWTFCGSGVLHTRHGAPVVITVADCPLCRNIRTAEPMCDFYTASFERLYRELVAPQAVAAEVACQANGAPCCVFEIRW